MKPDKELEEAKQILSSAAIRFFYNAIAGYLPVLIVLLITRYEPSTITAIAVLVPAVLLANYFKIAERVYDLPKKLNLPPI